MRIPGWLIGIVSFGMLIVATAICSFSAYGWTRQSVIELQAQSNVLLESPLDMVNIAFGADISDFAPTATETSVTTTSGGSGIVVLASPTPQTVAVEPTAQTADVVETPSEIVEATAIPTAVPTLDPMAELPEWTDPRQIRILLMGIDQRSATGDTGPFRTDTMMLINIDPVRKSVGVLSLPRDLYVDIPGYNVKDRINTANFRGDAGSYPGGGPALAMETVTQNFGIPVDKYVLVNFDVFITVVNTIAPQGIEVCPEERIYDSKYPDNFYGTIVVEFQAGCQRLDAEHLLQYARTRATANGDFDRAKRQQEVLEAARQEVLQAGGILNFATQIPVLWTELTGNFKTNLEMDDLIALGRLMLEIPQENIRYAQIGPGQVEFITTAAGEQVSNPIQSDVAQLINETFYPSLVSSSDSSSSESGDSSSTVNLADLRVESEAESAQIIIFNGAGIPGIASDTKEFLIGRGVTTIGEVGNMPDQTYTETIIRDYTGNPATAQYLAQLLGLSDDHIEDGNSADGLTTGDILIIVGPDIQSQLGQ